MPQTVITTLFDEEEHQFEEDTPQAAIAALRESYESGVRETELDLATITVACVIKIEQFPSWDDFIEQFNPIKNHMDDNAGFDGLLFETFGPEFDFVQSRSSECVWTLVESDNGDLILIVPGIHVVNRLGYLITEYSWEEGQKEFLS